MSVNSKQATFSVLICTYNRPHLLAQCLVALIDLTNEKPDQVVVVNGGDGRADQVVNSYRDSPCTQVVSVKTQNVNLAASRNVGLGRATGDIIAMTDDDAQVFPDWVTQMKRAHTEHPEAGAVGGAVIGTDSDSLLSRIADQATFVSYPTPRYVRTLPGVNISYKCAVIERVGLQDETLFRGEDVDYNWRVKQLGYEIYYDPAARVLHHHRPTLRAFLNQHYMYGRAYYLVRRKWPEMYCVYPHRITSLKDLLKVFFPVFLLFKFPLVASRDFARKVDRLMAFGTLVLIQTAWTIGICTQAAMSTFGMRK